jgi:cysteinyl-tRNA synthetase
VAVVLITIVVILKKAFSQREQPIEQVASLVEARDDARLMKDFSRADALRKELHSMGIHLTDGPLGTSWKKNH